MCDALVEVDDAYRRHGVRGRSGIIAARRTITGADAAQSLALGADLVTSAIGLRSPGELRREHLEVVVDV
ncbi:MAG: hypothetical protein EXR68_06265 [Dehalococcoidia bacterium]|nr:hypothetical protein [Dehalococcoidia bacterium]